MPQSVSLVRSRLIERFPNAVPVLIGVILSSGIAVIDRLTGPDVSFSLLYVLAVMTATWLGTRRHGMLVAGLAASQSLYAASRTAPLHGADAWNALTQLATLVLIAVLLAALRDTLERQRVHATQDSLTGALNRRAFQLLAERERLRAGREGTPLSVAYFDIDDFKDINDIEGHAAGDAVLGRFADSVMEVVRGTDVFARIGGDEFVLMLPATDARQSMLVVDRVRDLLRDVSRDHSSALTASVGLATYRFPPSTVEAMVVGADRLMYEAKERGGDTVVGMVYIGPWARWSEAMDAAEPRLATGI
jgi:diguanylate cyclase (GGDEF)-like protein